MHRKDIEQASVPVSGLSGSERIAQMMSANVVGGLDEYIGMAGTGSAQSGAPPATRADHMRASDGHRAEAMAAQLKLAARGIDELRARLDQAMKAPQDERSPDAVGHLVAVLADVKQEREALALVFREQMQAQLNEPAVRAAFLQASRASSLLDKKVWEAQALARRKGAIKADVDAIAINPERLATDVDGIGSRLELNGADDTKASAVTEKEAELQLESVRRSLHGLDESSQALVMAMREQDRSIAMTNVLPGLMSNARILEASLVDGVRPTKEMTKVAARIAIAMQTAWTDGQPFGLQEHSGLRAAHDRIPTVLDTLARLAKGKK